MEETKAVASCPASEFVRLLAASQSAMYAHIVWLLGSVMDVDELSAVQTFLDL